MPNGYLSLPTPIELIDRGQELHLENLRLRASLAAAEQARDAALQRAEAAEARPCVENCMQERAEGNGGCGACALCCKEQRERADAAESALSEARKESAGLREALDSIANGDDRCGSKYGPGCDGECQVAARRALAASPRETAPAAAPAEPRTCWNCHDGRLNWMECQGVKAVERGEPHIVPCPQWVPFPAAAPHNPQSEENDR